MTTAQASRRGHRRRSRHAGRQRRRHDVGRTARGHAAAARRSRCSTRRGFSTHIAAEVKDFRNTLVTDRKLLKFTNRSHRFALEAAEQALRRCRHPADGGRCAPLGLRGRRRHDDRGLRRSRGDARACGARRRARRRSPAHRRAGQRSARVLPRPGGRRTRAADAPLRHPRLRDVGAHRVRVRRPGVRHGDEADPPRLRRSRARRRLRFDDQPDRHRRILPAVGAVDRTTRRRSARAVRSTRRATASCWAKARASSCSRNGKRRVRAARASTPSSQATAIRCRAIASPTRRPTATGRSRRCARRWPTRGATPGDIDYINAHGTSTLDERSQRERGDPRGVRRRREARAGRAPPRARWAI